MVSNYPLVNQHNYGKSPSLIGKSTIHKWTIFNSYVKLPTSICDFHTYQCTSLYAHLYTINNTQHTCALCMGKSQKCKAIGSVCMVYILTWLGFLLMVNVTAYIPYIHTDPSWESYYKVSHACTTSQYQHRGFETNITGLPRVSIIYDFHTLALYMFPCVYLLHIYIYICQCICICYVDVPQCITQIYTISFLAVLSKSLNPPCFWPRSTVNHIDEEARNKTAQFNDFKTQMSWEPEKCEAWGIYVFFVFAGKFGGK